MNWLPYIVHKPIEVTFPNDLKATKIPVGALVDIDQIGLLLHYQGQIASLLQVQLSTWLRVGTLEPAPAEPALKWWPTEALSNAATRVLNQLTKRPDLALTVLRQLSLHRFLGPWLEDSETYYVRFDLGTHAEPVAEVRLTPATTGQGEWVVSIEGIAHLDHAFNTHLDAITYADHLLQQRTHLHELPTLTPALQEQEPPLTATPWTDGPASTHGHPSRRRTFVGIDPATGTDATGLVIAEVTQLPTNTNMTIASWVAYPLGPGTEPAKTGRQQLSGTKDSDLNTTLRNAMAKADAALRDAGWVLQT